MPEGAGLRASDPEQTITLVEELELNRPEEIRNASEDGKSRIKASATIRPANVSERSREALDGTTGEIQRRGVSVLLRDPLLVGDLYRISFDRDALDVAPVLSICDRCTMLNETAFEVHLRFLHEIALHERSDSSPT
ncbi:MAG: hypothetical protein H6832_03000 [Planctomycetes bacterium]|nr:hypothetical protein [Planctomycetota bacterium]MCB9917350.1 hypothetical protein [Planctomycetota bacterium]